MSDQPTIGQLIRDGERSISFEFLPPADEAGVEQLWRRSATSSRYQPTFVSVTYGAGGAHPRHHRRRSPAGSPARPRCARWPTSPASATPATSSRRSSSPTARPASATSWRCGATRAEGPSAPWTPTPGGLTYASELVELVHGLRRLQHRRRRLPRGAPRRRVARRRRPGAGGQGRGRGGVRGHPDVLPLAGLLRPGRPGPRRRVRHPDPAGHHADHEPQLRPPDGRALRRGRARSR